MAWELTEVSGNRTPSLQDSTVDVVATNIEPKLANALIRQLNQVCPLEDLRHVKRVRRRSECGEKSELSILLCLSTGPEDCSKGFPEDVQKIVDTYQLSPFIAKVGNAAIIVDPSSMQIIAKATDQTHQRDTSVEKINCARVKADNACSFPEATEEKYDNLLLSSSRVCNGLNMQVSCMNPWGWMKQRPNEKTTLPSEGGIPWHPLRHAAIVAIENAAERDRMLFPTSTSLTTKPQLHGNMENCPDNEPAKRLKIDTKDIEQFAHEAYCSDLSETNRPYLCTGLDIYLVWEPCTMCAMALVHQRFKRIFYAFPNPITGALGSVYRLHGEKSLNHHYSVFRIKVPDAYLNGSSDCSDKC